LSGDMVICISLAISPVPKTLRGLKEYLTPVIPDYFRRHPVYLRFGMRFLRLSPTSVADILLEANSYRNFPLCYQLSSVVQLMRQETACKFLLASTHHNFAAGTTSVLADKLVWVETSDFWMSATTQTRSPCWLPRNGHRGRTASHPKQVANGA
jgi:hypothetical protein